MIEIVARKAATGEVSINKARMHLARHEWGLARMALEDGLSKGGLIDHFEAEELLQDICNRLHNGPELDRMVG
ncbi:MAG: hypothetical protein KDI04_07650 [Halieaceae bacterium]|nr:hypothetical protein [Halieaceae bacterium]MCP5194805.1 hypothetical protein [Pseudomonadales bacterium]